ncbi:hypothetical protein FBY40_0159 [Microbacterium sp. SLBN-154]|uniref:VOC family protein n=1 Tax=Microbacterium sp. SLBN-154 TaxID=2768458 RepID=UPI001153A5DB|nr:VOC family protein [Microbacterium sp. SLBN-154]TQK17682.1 hypothetical protein FBY40_0159 [Microbacterium sp. SLBN-154]
MSPALQAFLQGGIRGTGQNPVVYFEVPVARLERAIRFYEALLECSLEPVIIDGQRMALFPVQSHALGVTGALAEGESYSPSGSGARLYFGVRSIGEAVGRAIEAGGSLLDIGVLDDLSEIVDLWDTEGNRVALLLSE